MIVIATITGTATATLTSTTIATVTATPYTNLGRIARYRLYNDSVIFSVTGTLTVTLAVTGTVTSTARATVAATPYVGLGRIELLTIPSLSLCHEASLSIVKHHHRLFCEFNTCSIRIF